MVGVTVTLPLDHDLFNGGREVPYYTTVAGLVLHFEEKGRHNYFYSATSAVPLHDWGGGEKHILCHWIRTRFAGWVELSTSSSGLSPLLLRAVTSAPQASRSSMRDTSCLRAASWSGVFRLLMAFTQAPSVTQHKTPHSYFNIKNEHLLCFICM